MWVASCHGLGAQTEHRGESEKKKKSNGDIKVQCDQQPSPQGGTSSLDLELKQDDPSDVRCWLSGSFVTVVKKVTHNQM